MAAVISNQGGYYSAFAYVSEARRMGLTILPPDVRNSDECWTGIGAELRVGLQSVGQLERKTASRIVCARQRRPFCNPEDFFNRTRPAAPEARALIHAGALDSLNNNRDRTSLLWQFADWQQRKAASSCPDLFGVTAAPVPIPELPCTDQLTTLRREFAVLGFLVGHHPLEFYSCEKNTLKARELPAHVGKTICCAGWLITGKTVQTKHGEVMEFLTFEDETDIFETTFFPQVYKRYCHLLDNGRPFLLTGTVEEDYGAVTLTVAKVAALSPAGALPTRRNQPSVTCTKPRTELAT
jgi:DNA polymerase-3 subunit alpha/error-prone DNA polymerase